jgi:hypothetical protein
MKQRKMAWLGIAVLVAGGLAACSKSSTESPDTSAGASGGSTTAAKKTEAPAIVVPAGTPLTVRLETELGSKTSNAGDPFEATVTEPVAVGGKVVIPTGAHASGEVTQAHAAGRFKGASSLNLILKSVTIDGQPYAIQTSSVMEARKGKGKRSAAFIGGGAAGGALLGGLLGGGKGAAIGAAAGAGAGTAGAGLTGNRDIVLPVETLLRFKLTADLSVKGK